MTEFTVEIATVDGSYVARTTSAGALSMWDLVQATSGAIKVTVATHAGIRWVVPSYDFESTSWRAASAFDQVEYAARLVENGLRTERVMQAFA